MEIWKSKIYAKFFDMLRECKRLKRWWFYFKAAREVVKEKYPEEASTFKLLYWRFKGFCRHEVSIRRKTHAAQKSPAALCNAIENFREQFLQERKRVNFIDLANMDQTPLFFVMDNNTTSKNTVANEIWIASGQSRLKKSQCTVQLTAFADGINCHLFLYLVGKDCW